MSKGTDIAKKIVEYLKEIFPSSATKTEIFSNVGIKGCTGNPWLNTLIASRKIEVSGKKGRYNLYRYNNELH